jgi:hypothetical protein
MHDLGLLPTVKESLDPALQVKIGSLLLGQRPDSEDGNRADLHALGFSFAAIAINDRSENACLVLAVRVGWQRRHSRLSRQHAVHGERSLQDSSHTCQFLHKLG